MLLHQREAIAAVRNLTDQFSQDCRTETYYEPDGRVHSLCVLPREADKGSALEFVARKLEIPLDQTLAIGDNANDMPMFAAAGVSAAMGNATPEVKAAATVVGPSNDDEGAALGSPAVRNCGIPIDNMRLGQITGNQERLPAYRRNGVGLTDPPLNRPHADASSQRVGRRDGARLHPRPVRCRFRARRGMIREAVLVGQSALDDLALRRFVPHRWGIPARQNLEYRRPVECRRRC